MERAVFPLVERVGSAASVGDADKARAPTFWGCCRAPWGVAERLPGVASRGRAPLLLGNFFRECGCTGRIRRRMRAAGTPLPAKGLVGIAGRVAARSSAGRFSRIPVFFCREEVSKGPADATCDPSRPSRVGAGVGQPVSPNPQARLAAGDSQRPPRAGVRASWGDTELPQPRDRAAPP